jgi:DNA mismatch endonuclease (patch repair protein)
MDIVDKEKRSLMMANISSRNTKPEIMIRKFLHGNGFRYRLHVRSLPGTPDLVLPKYKLAIFIHGCFWHQHRDCRYATMPSQNVEKWKQKFSDNKKRDEKSIDQLRASGWRVLVIWECAIRTQRSRLELDKIKLYIADRKIYMAEWPLPTEAVAE